jgi:hypothetical protein
MYDSLKAPSYTTEDALGLEEVPCPELQRAFKSCAAPIYRGLHMAAPILEDMVGLVG